MSEGVIEECDHHVENPQYNRQNASMGSSPISTVPTNDGGGKTSISFSQRMLSAVSGSILTSLLGMWLFSS